MPNKLFSLFLVIISVVFFTLCTFSESDKEGSPMFMIWERETTLSNLESDEQIEAYFLNLTNHNISALYLDASSEYYKRIVPIANKVNLQIFTWIPTMIYSDQNFMKENKDWYSVNRNGISCVDSPPYVDYYRWFCPNEPKVLEYLVNKYLELANINGITGIHLDYIRYCDIFLPKGLWEKYNLIQDYEMAEFDYCYCHRCREGFEKKYGQDPLKFDDPASNLNWKNWRLNSIVKLTNTISKKIKNQTGKLVTAAVFPTPRMSENMVRQAWGRFEIDAVLPMLYNGFYEEDVEWIGKCVKEGIDDMEIKKKLYAGVFVQDLMEINKFTKALKSALENGADGVSFFSGSNLTDEHLQIVKNYH